MTISFRYNVIGGLHTGDQERLYHSVAQSIANGTMATMALVLEALKPIYPADESFRAAFSDKVIKTTATRNKKIVRYILCALEKQAGGGDFEFESASYNLEHILPQNSTAGWETFTDEELDTFVYRLGNMALMESGPNRDVGNGGYATKKIAYAASVFLLTRKVAAENEEWTPSRIETRQRALANIATSVWRVAQLS